MQPIPPFWFLMRQGKLELAGDDICRVTAPNLAEAFIGIRAGDNGRWSAFLRRDGPIEAAGPTDFAKKTDAWEAAFELYRIHLVV